MSKSEDYKKISLSILGDLAIIATKKTYLLPSYLYYQIEYINEHKISAGDQKIQYVTFENEPDVIYDINKMKGVYDWDGLK